MREPGVSMVWGNKQKLESETYRKTENATELPPWIRAVKSLLCLEGNSKRHEIPGTQLSIEPKVLPPG